ncbi:MAG TPA: hypothetical protein VEA19_07660 [Actinomycetota bacterium]|nr:hypothetical protein [Actinomycetota bacterium]
MAVGAPADWRKFALLRSGVEAVIQRVGRNTWDAILIDTEGNWTRAVFPSKTVAQEACRKLEVPINEGWDPRMQQRMNRRDHWGDPGGQKRAAYPEGTRPLET